MSFKDNFRGDSAYSHIMTKVFDICWLSLLWLFCSLPVITIGISTTALYYVMLKLVRDEETAITRTFFRAFKENLRQGFGAGIMLISAVGIVAADFHILGSQQKGTASVMYGCCVVILIVLTAVFTYAFPLIAKFQNTLGKQFGNAARLAASHLWQTVVMVLVNLFPVGWFLISPETFSVVFWIWVFVGMGIQSFVNTLLLSPILKKLEEQ